MDPQREDGITRGVAGPADPPVQRVQSPDLSARRRQRAVDDPLVAAERAVQAAPRILPEVGVLVDPGGHGRVRELEQQRPGTDAQDQHRLAVELPRLRSRPEHPDGLGLRIHAGTISREPRRTLMGRWGADFEPARVASLETRMWKAYLPAPAGPPYGRLG